MHSSAPTREPGQPATTGLLVGLCLVTKMTAFIALPLALLALVLVNSSPNGERRRGVQLNASTGHTPAPGSCARRRARGLRSPLAALCLPALALWLPWLVRNVATYGLGDPLGQARHDAVVLGQLRTAARLAQVGLVAMVRQGATLAFESFWGIFGWMGVPMHEQVYLVLGLAMAVAAVGLVARAWTWRRVPPAQRQRSLLLLLAFWGGLSLAELAWYNLKFVQPQGRYLFIAMPVWAALLLEGLDGARRRGLVIAPLMLAASALLYLLGLITGDRHDLAAALLLLGAIALAAWSLLSRCRGTLAAIAPLAALWLLDMAGALYYVNRYL